MRVARARTVVGVAQSPGIASPPDEPSLRVERPKPILSGGSCLATVIAGRREPLPGGIASRLVIALEAVEHD